VNGRDAVSWAAGNGHLQTISILVRSKRIGVSEKDNKRRNAISWACSGGHYAVVKYLIKQDPAGVDEEDVDGWTSLARALNSHAPNIVGALLASGLVNPIRRDAMGRTPIAWAAGYGYLDIVRMLMRLRVWKWTARKYHERPYTVILTW
jgi:ankyrin repeat protein